MATRFGYATTSKTSLAHLLLKQQSSELVSHKAEGGSEGSLDASGYSYFSGSSSHGGCVNND